MIRSAAIGAMLLPVVLAGCGSGDDGKADDPATTEKIRLPHGDDPFKLNAAELSPDVTNPWFPLEPGTRWTYREVDEDGEVLEVVVTATPVTRNIANGAEARVVRDTVTLDGEIVEDTLDWYAQDARGTVWYLGEDTAEFEDGYITSHEGSFEAGVDDALAGVIMPAVPMVGQAYRQEYYGGVAEDNGEVLALDGTATVPAGSYDGPGADRRHERHRAGRARAQVLRPRRGRGADHRRGDRSPGRAGVGHDRVGRRGATGGPGAARGWRTDARISTSAASPAAATAASTRSPGPATKTYSTLRRRPTSPTRCPAGLWMPISAPTYLLRSKPSIRTCGVAGIAEHAGHLVGGDPGLVVVGHHDDLRAHPAEQVASAAGIVRRVLKTLRVWSSRLSIRLHAMP